MKLASYAFLLGLMISGHASAAPLLPTENGTTWEYEQREEPASAEGPVKLSVRVVGTERAGGKELLTFETRAGDKLTKTELIEVDDTGIRLHRRTDQDGNDVSPDSPQTLVPAPLQIGAKWELYERAGAARIRQQFTVVAQEPVRVPAGTYYAYRLHAEQPWPFASTTDRSFAPGVGFVKEVSASRGPGGRLLSRSTLVLTRISHAVVATPTPASTPTSAEESPPASPQPSAAPGTPEIQLEVAAERDGESRTEFQSDAREIFVRWAGQRLPLDSIVRVAWVAEDVGDVAPPNFIVDDTETAVTQPDYGARFTLSRPRDGWAAGRYRVDLYIDDVVAKSVGVVITD